MAAPPEIVGSAAIPLGLKRQFTMKNRRSRDRLKRDAAAMCHGVAAIGLRRAIERILSENSVSV